MKAANIAQYCALMEEIKCRVAVVQGFLNGSWHTMYLASTIESVCLQVRKILELVALGSLVLNKDEYQRVHAEFAKHWNAPRILRDIERVNPHFYPQPFKDINGKFVDITSSFLTRKKFPDVYVKCGAILHADNPYGSRVDYAYYQRSVQTWLTEIMVLLGAHRISLLDDPSLYVVHMKEGEDDKVHAYTFVPIDRPEANNSIQATPNGSPDR